MLEPHLSIAPGKSEPVGICAPVLSEFGQREGFQSRRLFFGAPLHQTGTHQTSTAFDTPTFLHTPHDAFASGLGVTDGNCPWVNSEHLQSQPQTVRSASP